ncbi:MAG: hypothetical protein BTN85_0422 [Candidatus Methanohalarchaeum thermophilum]|uniref:Uncharacterized protein n=1 Tax=Methanohalarchaeum thermophilum TaxID=1903181 RepID=A0A1Q6DUA2_METT1|nr:MAG: hypothetical protein BTN85_0422 [Candidatus Methanohalarchaeum thermophilum]
MVEASIIQEERILSGFNTGLNGAKNILYWVSLPDVVGG